jgi:LEA14-like dessication related protein
MILIILKSSYIAVSALQWIFKDLNNKIMRDNLINLIKSYYRILKPNLKVVIQFYPKIKEIMDEIGKVVTQNTQFKGKFIIDNPNNPRKRKIY